MDHNKKKTNSYQLTSSKYLNQVELSHLEKTLQTNINTDQRNCLMLYLALKTGARAQEVLNLKKEDLNEYYKTVFIRGLKNSRDREIPIKPSIFLQLLSYSKTIEGELLFPVSYMRFWQIWMLYRPTKKNLHCLRHTFAIELYRKTNDIRLVQVALGHKNIQNSMIYADYHYTHSELRKSIL